MFFSNLQYYRKKNGLTQEMFAEKMEVSRQTVSKWEQGDAYPEMDRLIKICEMFECDLDTLVRGDYNEKMDINNISTDGDIDNTLSSDSIESKYIDNKLEEEYLQDFNNYNKVKDLFSLIVAGFCSFILFGVSSMMILFHYLGENQVWGVILLLGFIMVGLIPLLIVCYNDYDFRKNYPLLKDFYTDQQKKSISKRFVVCLTLGISMCLVGVILLLAGISSFGEYMYLSLAVLLCCIGIGVFFIVYGTLQLEKIEINEYNSESLQDSTISSDIDEIYKLKYKNELERVKKAKSKISEVLISLLWLFSIAIYLIISFTTERWDLTWIVFPFAALLSAAIEIVSVHFERKNK